MHWAGSQRPSTRAQRAGQTDTARLKNFHAAPIIRPPHHPQNRTKETRENNMKKGLTELVFIIDRGSTATVPFKKQWEFHRKCGMLYAWRRQRAAFAGGAK
jgi:hypothetical protein